MKIIFITHGDRVLIDIITKKLKQHNISYNPAVDRGYKPVYFIYKTDSFLPGFKFNVGDIRSVLECRLADMGKDDIVIDMKELVYGK